MSSDRELPDEAGRPARYRPRRRHRLAAAAVGLIAVGVAAASGSAVASRFRPVLTTSQIAARVDPGLVDVTSTLGYQHAASAGTGLVLTSSGEVLTNNHVVEGATAVKVTDVGNGRSYRAVVVGYDRTQDIAVLQMIGAANLRTVRLGDSSRVSIGQRVVALGNAGGKGGTPSVARGRVVSVGDSITAADAAASASEQLSGLIHTNAPIQPGDSGGALADTAGRVIAINTAASAASGFQFQSGNTHTQAYSIPIARALSIAHRIEAHRSSATVHIGATAFVGVQILPGTKGAGRGPGAMVAGVLAGSPAARAGLAAGDVITSVGGYPVTSPSGLQSALGRYHPGDRVPVGWHDATGVPHTATIVLAKGPAG